MLLFEFEGKQLFKNCGLNLPQSQLIKSPTEKITLRGTLLPLKVKPPLFLKAQVLAGDRAGGGGIIRVNSIDELESSLKKLFSASIKGHKVEEVLVEEAVETTSE